eukprot:Gb_17580 [translate_table: standard]
MVVLEKKNSNYAHDTITVPNGCISISRANDGGQNWEVYEAADEVVDCGNHEQHSRPPPTIRLTDQFSHLSFREGYSVVWGGPNNVQQLNGGNLVRLILDKSSGSGFISQDDFYYGFFSAAIKLPANYSAGIVVAFYTSNADVYPHTHDELDFEFLGHTTRKQWVLQTNVYGNGSVNMGREERYHLWFDPTAEFHEYSILWNFNHTVFLVDNIPIREVVHTKAMGVHYPSKPMSVYSTIWDGSGWATEGGKYPVDYRFSPFVSSYTNLELDGCVWNPTQSTPLCSFRSHSRNPIGGSEFVSLNPQQRIGLHWVRKRFLIYSYCDDHSRYPTAPPECQNQRRSGNGRNTDGDDNVFGQEQGPTMTQFAKYGRMKFSLPPSQRMPRPGMDTRTYGLW